MNMLKQARYDRYFMDIAERTAAMSYAEKRKVLKPSMVKHIYSNLKE
jgi:hypothetical protein